MSKKKKEQGVAHENVNSPGYRIGFNSKVFSAMKKYISIMMILACVAIHAKNKNDFNAWLSLMEEISNDNLSRLNSASLDERVETERYGQFLPQADETCPCDTESIWWLRGVYKPVGETVVAILPRVCFDYHDEMRKFQVENLVIDFVLLTYSPRGELLGHKVIGHHGAAYFSRLQYHQEDSTFISEQGRLIDGNLLKQFKPLVFSVAKYKYTIDGKGNVKEKQIGQTWNEVVRAKDTRCEELTFEQFHRRFRKWNEKHINDSIFLLDGKQEGILSPSIHSFIPDSTDCRCWPRDIVWWPGYYVETKDSLYYFLTKDCSTPKEGEPFLEYFMLVFSKEGALLETRKINKTTDIPIPFHNK